jgi:cytochrome c-type biogenesis protein CcmE
VTEPDLSPRTVTATGAPTRRKRRWGVVAALVVIVGALAVVLYQGLANATLFFCNADEVGQRSECRGDKRFRLHGIVDDGSVVEDGATLRFTVTYNGATIPVTYQGEPGGIFQEGIPVVVEGRLASAGDGAAPVFDGDRILVKHTEQYIEDNPGRVPEGAP